MCIKKLARKVVMKEYNPFELNDVKKEVDKTSAILKNIYLYFVQPEIFIDFFFEFLFSLKIIVFFYYSFHHHSITKN